MADFWKIPTSVVQKLDDESVDELMSWLDKNYKAAHKNGMVEGVSLYAHWRDGEQYVGTCGKTLKKAIKEIEND